MEKRIAVIDLGSNSIRLVIYSIMQNGAVKVINDISDSVRLIANMTENGMLGVPSMDKALNAIKLYRELCDAYYIDSDSVIAVATEAVRQAGNRDEFLRNLLEATGISFRVLDGDQECMYIFNAAIRSICEPEGLVADIGGGSAEIVRFFGKSAVGFACLKTGAVNMTEGWLGKDRIDPDKLDRLERYLEEYYRAYDWISGMEGGVLIGLGGTFRNLARMHRRRVNYPMEVIHNYRMSLDDFNDIYDEMKRLDLDERKSIDGLSSSRADIIVAGLAIIKTLLHISGAKQLAISGDGLREGIVREYVDSLYDGPEQKDALEQSILSNMEIYGLNREHACHVCDIALSLFDSMLPYCDLRNEERRLLRTAALLHDIGLVINFYGRPMHSSYVLLNCRLDGLSHREILIVSAIVGNHGKSCIKKGWFKSFDSILDEEDDDFTVKLSLLLKLAECFDKSGVGKIARIECDIDKMAVHVRTFHTAEAGLEIMAARKCACEFKKVFDKELFVD